MSNRPAVLPLRDVVVFPYVRFIGEPAKSDTFGLLPLWTANAHLLAGSYWATVLAVALGLVALLALIPVRHAVVVPIVLLGVFVVLSRPVWSGPHGVLRSGEGALFQGIRGVPRDWIDGSVPTRDEVAVLWTGRADRFTVNQNEFFNRRVGRVYYTSQPTPGDFLAAYEDLGGYERILSLHIAGKLSGTIESARAAAKPPMPSGETVASAPPATTASACWGWGSAAGCR